MDDQIDQWDFSHYSWIVGGADFGFPSVTRAQIVTINFSTFRSSAQDTARSLQARRLQDIVAHMAFRSASQRLCLAQLSRVSQLNRGLTQGAEKSAPGFRSLKWFRSSSEPRPYEELHASCPRFGQQFYRNEYCRSLSTGLRSETEERVEREGTVLTSSAETTSSAASSGDSSRPSETSVNISVESAYVSSPRHDLAMLFTCTVCETRSAKTMSRASYETGVVIVRCPGCKNLHLIADRYGWFGEKGGVEDFLAEKGIDVRTGSEASYEFTMDDLAGWSPQEKPGKV
ncbi:hypothetical protein R1sor_009772 [Riccia sorocarpa]|uniref:DNL-type domain-containing protein n=1 Tax=Riccia sorocarpa TaxID=122646 RepID=A0ABD3I058_9MARC